MKLTKSQLQKTAKKIIRENSSTQVSVGGNAQGVDDGPSYFYGNNSSYKSMTSREAEKLGFFVVDYLINGDKEIEEHDTAYPNGPIGDVSFAPAGVMDDYRGERADITGKTFWAAYKKHITGIAETLGYKIIDFLGADAHIHHMEKTKVHSKGEDSKETKKKTSHQQHKDTKVIKETFSKDWWTKQLVTE